MSVVFTEIAVEGGQFLAIARLAYQGSQDVERLKVIGHLVAHWELDQLVVEPLQRQPQRAITCAELEKRSELRQENPVVADIVDHRQMRLVR